MKREEMEARIAEENRILNEAKKNDIFTIENNTTQGKEIFALRCLGKGLYDVAVFPIVYDNGDCNTRYYEFDENHNLKMNAYFGYTNGGFSKCQISIELLNKGIEFVPGRGIKIINPETGKSIYASFESLIQNPLVIKKEESNWQDLLVSLNNNYEHECSRYLKRLKNKFYHSDLRNATEEIIITNCNSTKLGEGKNNQNMEFMLYALEDAIKHYGYNINEYNDVKKAYDEMIKVLDINDNSGYEIIKNITEKFAKKLLDICTNLKKYVEQTKQEEDNYRYSVQKVKTKGYDTGDTRYEEQINEYLNDPINKFVETARKYQEHVSKIIDLYREKKSKEKTESKEDLIEEIKELSETKKNLYDWMNTNTLSNKLLDAIKNRLNFLVKGDTSKRRR